MLNYSVAELRQTLIFATYALFCTTYAFVRRKRVVCVKKDV